jgi:hypothetical protein
MSYDDGSDKSSGYKGIRSSLHIGMGVVYLVLGGIAVVGKYFGKFELDPIKAYVLGGIMILYGAFRLWRGVQDIRMRKLEKMNDDFDRIPKS